MGWVAIQPQQIHIAAPQSLVYDLVSMAEYGDRPDSHFSIQLVERRGRRAVLRTMNWMQPHRPSVAKELIPLSPDRICYRHVSGPLTGAVEVIQLMPDAEGTIALARAHFAPEDGVASGTPRLRLAEEVREHLLEIKAAAEQRAARANAQAPQPQDLPAELLTGETALQQLVGAQEEEEFGHLGHATGVARVAASLGTAIGLAGDQLEEVRRAALLHDVGKIAIDPALWAHRGTLDQAQRRQMEAHVTFGYELACLAVLSEVTATAIRHHHERWDGQGYPQQLAGEAIPIAARVLFVAEVTDSMLRTSYRRQALAPARVAEVLDAGAGRQWDPRVARQAANIMRGRP